MNKTPRLLLLAVIPMAFMQCYYPNETDLITEISQVDQSTLLSNDNPSSYHGKALTIGTESTNTVSENALEKVQLPQFTKELVKGLRYQLKVLNYRKKEQLKVNGEVDPSIEKLEQTVQLLLDQQNAQIPKSGFSSFERAIFSFESFCLVARIAASATLLLLIASIRLTLPIEFSGEIGLIASSKPFIFSLVCVIASKIFFFNASFSSLVIFIV